MSTPEVKSMEIKKPTQVTESAVKNATSKKNITEFVDDVKGEIFKIQWTSREELITYAKIVVVSTLTFGLAIYFMDLMIQGTLNALNQLLQLVI